MATVELDSALDILSVVRRPELVQAMLSTNIFEDAPSGLASGLEYFSVPSADAAEYLVLYRNESGAAAVVDTYPNVVGVTNARDAAEAFAVGVLSVAQEVSADRLASQQAADAAQLSAGVYATTAAGLLATPVDRYFSVPPADSAEYLILYKNVAGVAVEVNRYPSSQRVADASSDAWSKVPSSRALLSGYDDFGGTIDLDADLNPVGGPGIIALLAEEVDQALVAYDAAPKRALLSGYDDFPSEQTLDADGILVDGPEVVIQLAGLIEAEAGARESAISAISSSLASPSREPVFVEAGVLKKVDARGDKTVADLSPKQFLSPPYWRGPAVITATDRTSMGAKTPVAVSTLGDGFTCVVPSGRDLLIVIPSYGQSNSVGAQAYAPPSALTDNQWPENLLMFDLASGVADIRMGLPAGGAAVGAEEVLSGANLTGFKPLISVQSAAQSNRGATALEGIGFTVQAMAAQYLGFQPSVLMFAAGYGSRPYRDLKKGTIPYTNFLTALARAKALADQQGYVMYVPFIALVHGEGDSTNVSYAADLVQLQADMQADVQAVTGQAGTVPMACSQASTFFSTEVNGVLDTYKVSKSSALHSLSAPYYPYEMYSGDELHLGNRGLYLGEKMARTILRDSKLWGASGKGALKPIGVSFDGANTLDIALEVPFPPLVRDQANPIVNTPAPSNWGFEVQDGTGAAVAISSVQIIGNSIRIVTAATPAGGAQRAIRYAMTGYAGTQNGGGVRVKGYQPRGQVRDSESTPSIVDGSPLYNWLVHFSENF